LQHTFGKHTFLKFFSIFAYISWEVLPFFRLFRSSSPTKILDFPPSAGVLKTPWFPPKDFHRLASRGASGSGLGRGESLAALVARFDKVLLLSKALVLAAYLGGWFHPSQKRGEMVPSQI